MKTKALCKPNQPDESTHLIWRGRSCRQSSLVTSLATAIRARMGSSCKHKSLLVSQVRTERMSVHGCICNLSDCHHAMEMATERVIKKRTHRQEEELTEKVSSELNLTSQWPQGCQASEAYSKARAKLLEIKMRSLALTQQAKDLSTSKWGQWNDSKA